MSKRQSYEENLTLARLNPDSKKFILETNRTYLMEPGTATVQVGQNDVDLNYDHDSRTTIITIRCGESTVQISYGEEDGVTAIKAKNQVGEGISGMLCDYPEEEPPTYDNGNIMAEMVRRAEEQRSILRHGYA